MLPKSKPTNTLSQEKLSTHQEPNHKSLLRKRIPLFIMSIFLIIFFIKIILPPLNFLKQNQITSSLLVDLIINKEYPLKKDAGRTNFLLLGIAGENHEGVDLTDTMIFISIDFVKNDVLFLSLPRDIWLDSLKDKINTAYHYGEEKKQAGGFMLSRTSVEEVTGQPIHYTLLLDFAGFKKLIDLVGGIDVEVENSFIDKKYPLAGRENDLCNGDKEYKCRYETVKFDKGIQHMDGERALKFVRSRYAEGDEGTDFARGKRQQKIIVAFQKKLLSLNNLSLNKINQFIRTLKETIKTDLTFTEAAYLARFGLRFKGTMRSIPLDYGNQEKKEEGFLINPPVEKYDRWVLVPRTGNFTEIHNYISCYLKDSNCKITPKTKMY